MSGDQRGLESVRLCDECGQTYYLADLAMYDVPGKGSKRLCPECIDRLERCPHDETVIKLCAICCPHGSA